MQPSISRGSSVSLCHRNDGNHPFFEVYCAVFIRCTTALTCCHSLPVVVTLYHSFSLFVTCYHSLSFVAIRCHSLSFVVTRFTTRCHSLSFIVTRCTTRCHSLSLAVLLVCLFIKDRKYSAQARLHCVLRKKIISV